MLVTRRLELLLTYPNSKRSGVTILSVILASGDLIQSMGIQHISLGTARSASPNKSDVISSSEDPKVTRNL